MLHIHRAERADGLIEALAELLRDPLEDPFASEVIAVPSRGMERWLTQRLSMHLGATPGRSDGVCANVEFPFPRKLVEDALAVASGIAPERDRWRPERAVWPLLEVVDECLEEQWMRLLARHISDRSRRFGSVRHIAGLFDRYALQRPEMVRAWAAGDDGPKLPDGARWQPELWRRLRAQLNQPSTAERLEPGCARLAEQPQLVDLPPRFSLFGLTRLPPARLQVLRALAAGRDVHLFLLHPSPALWERVRSSPRVRRRADDATAQHAENRLLASWGRDAREMQLVLGGDTIEHHHAIEAPAGTLLARVQADIRANRPAAAHEPDESIRVHACHGRARQVEVLRDAILHELQRDRTLEPRDVIVMCPDIEAFAPLIQATFGVVESDSSTPDLRVRLADRALRQTNPVLAVVSELLDLAAGRMTASQLLDLADREPVRRRFRFDDDDLSRVQSWVRDSGIRWGLDAAHRAPFQLTDLPGGTWRTGLNRLLLGVTMTEEGQRLFNGVLPLDDVDSRAIDLAGRFAEFIDRVTTAVDVLTTPRTIAAWADALVTHVSALTDTREAWQHTELQRLLHDIVGEAGEDSRVELALPELRDLLAERLQGRPTRANFRTGHLTICTLLPMRSVPHRVVCLLGLDDGEFPRKSPQDGDDLLLDDPHIGDRDARIEDRQLLLDALMAAQDRLIVTYTGNDERTNVVRPPAVPVGELLDAVGHEVVVRHPLQPFDPRNFPWSFDAVALEGARALTRERRGRGPFLAERLPPRVQPVIEVDELVRFVQHPVRAFLRQRLGIGVRDYDDEIEDDLAVELDGLGKWAVGERLVESLLAGVDQRDAALAEIARGTLPPGQLGLPVVEAVFPVARAIVEAAAGLLDADSIDVRVGLPESRSLRGTVPGVAGDTVRTVTYSRVAAKHRLTSWVRLLALTVAHPERSFRAATIGRGEDGVAVARIPPLDAAVARPQLDALIALYDRGMREPLPLYCKTSAAFAASGADAARREWTSAWRRDSEDKEPEHTLVLGGEVAFDELAPEFAALAGQLWSGLLAVEEIG